MARIARIDTLPILHLRIEGHSEELLLSELGLSLAASDSQIKAAVARHLERSSDSLDDYVVVRHDQTIVVRPEAIYG